MFINLVKFLSQIVGDEVKRNEIHTKVRKPKTLMGLQVHQDGRVQYPPGEKCQY